MWPGKRTQVERVALPFQVVETVNQSRAHQPALQPAHPDPVEGRAAHDGWTNKLIWGDNKYVMASLLQGDPSIGLEPLAGKIDLIYIDPPFATGQDFSYRARVGDKEWVKEASIIEETAYRDTWGRGMESYLQMMYERLVLMRELLAEDGSLLMHIQHPVAHYLNAILDELFGVDYYDSQIIWYFTNKYGAGSAAFDVFHHIILHYTKSARFTYNPVMVPVKEPRKQPVRRWNKKLGKNEWLKDEHGNYLYRESTEKELGDVWEVPVINPVANERLGFETQKPERLLEIALRACSNERSLICDFFCGSGTTMAVAEKLGRRWIGCDLSRYAIQVTRKRMLDIADCRSFQVLNLGQYERKHWQVNVLNGKQGSPDKAVADYLRFIVALYHAEPVGGYTHLHGQKAGRWVHVGATDAPVTRSEVVDAVRECQAHRYTGLDVLGWEWEMGLHDTVGDEAKRMGVDLRLLVIPREVMDRRAVQAGDVHFYELAYLKTSLLQDRRSVTVRLEDFIIPNLDLVPDEVRSKVKKWSDYIDFWAVDWSFQGDTFHNEWQTYRTRKSPTLRLLSDPHTYEAAGSYKVLVKVIDIFGNDTTQLLAVKVP